MYPGGRTLPFGETHPQGVSLANEKRRGRNRRQAKIAAVSATTARAMGVCQFIKCPFFGKAEGTSPSSGFRARRGLGCLRPDGRFPSQDSSHRGFQERRGGWHAIHSLGVGVIPFAAAPHSDRRATEKAESSSGKGRRPSQSHFPKCDRSSGRPARTTLPQVCSAKRTGDAPGNAIRERLLWCGIAVDGPGRIPVRQADRRDLIS